MTIHYTLYAMELTLLTATVWALKSIARSSLPWKLAATQLCVAVLVEGVGAFSKSNPVFNTFMYNCYILAELLILGIAGLHWLKGRNARRCVLALMMAYVPVWIYNIAVYEKGSFANLAFIYGCIVLAITYFMLLYQSVIGRPERIYRLPLFWLCTGIIIYFGCSIPLFSLFHYFTSHGKEKLGVYLYSIIDILAIFRYGSTFYAFLLHDRGNKSMNERIE